MLVEKGLESSDLAVNLPKMMANGGLVDVGMERIGE